MDGWSSEPDPQWGVASPAPAPRQHTALTLGDVLDGMFRLLISNWRVYLVAIGILVVPFNIVTGWVTTEAMGGLGMWVDLIRNPTGPAAAPADPSTALGAGYAVVQFLSFFVVTPLTWGLASHIAAGAYQGETPSAGDAWRATLKRYWALLGLIVLFTLIFIGVVGVGAVLVAVSAATTTAAVVVVAVLVALGLTAWLMVKLMSFSLPALAVEGAGPGAALGRSWKLVSGRFWRLLGTWLLIMLILMVVSAVFIGGFALLGAPLGTTGALVGAFLGSIVLGLLTTPLMVNAATLLYFDSRIRSEAYDLDVLSQQVSAHQPPATEPPFG